METHLILKLVNGKACLYEYRMSAVWNTSFMANKGTQLAGHTVDQHIRNDSVTNAHILYTLLFNWWC